ncbi:MAG: ATP-NAD kinase family protein [Chloroflexia bacterium]
MRKRLGLIVNPVAGLGGRVGLKGSDGEEIQRQARALGALAPAAERAAAALERLRPAAEEFELITYPAEMGEAVARGCGLEPTVIGEITPGRTTAADTRRAAREMMDRGVALLLFAGGDGTARDVYDAIGEDLPALGIPTGVKMHSAVFGTHPTSAGELALLFLRGKVGLREAEVMDIDEEALRQGQVRARLYGYLRIPFERQLVQSLKSPSGPGEREAMRAIAADVAEGMVPGVAYVLGPGTTTRAIAERLGVPKTLLGVDVVRDGQVVALDVNEAYLLRLSQEGPVKVIVTPIGGQGYLFGRGNQQISPAVLRRIGRENILVVSTSQKLQALGGRPLLVDTGDPDVDRWLCGYYRVITGYRERTVYRVSC